MEEWRPVVGYEGLYEVSDRGRVRSLKGSLFKQSECNGYFRVKLKGKTFSTHRLVLASFKPHHPPGKNLVLHGNGNPGDNRLENLRWGDQKENMADRRRHGNDPNLNKTHCPQGHPYSQDNTHVTGKRARMCLLCKRSLELSRKDLTLAPEDNRHGSLNAYNHYKCRCPACREAYRKHYRTTPRSKDFKTTTKENN